MNPTTAPRTDAVAHAMPRGAALLHDPAYNKGTAFSERERDALGLRGLLPPRIFSQEEQVRRVLENFRRKSAPLEKYIDLANLHDRNEALFFRLLIDYPDEMMPIVYTPTVGLGCQYFSQSFRKPRGLFLSMPHKERIARILGHPRFDNVEAIVVTDGERILGLGDQGAGGMGIPIGKLSLYTGCGGLHPATTLPILLDVGTDNPERLSDPLYIGWRHERVRGEAYDDFIEAFIQAVVARWPHVLLQWEDFARDNATRLLECYRDRLCTFNDDVQGTAVVAAGALLAAVNVTSVPMREQRIAVLGAGGAGCGISALLLRAMTEDGLPEAEARRRFFLVDRDGLLVEGMTGLMPFQEPFVQPRDAVAGWTLDQTDRIGLADVVRNAKPTVLIGVSGQPGAFPESVVRDMAAHVQRPVIFPLSNPTSRAEAKPADVMAWTEGRAVVGAGSPFPPLTRNGVSMRVDQTNNSYVFPGIGLAAIAVQARRISDGMLMAAARALADVSPARLNPNANLLPPVSELRDVSLRVAQAVAMQARREGLTEPMDAGDMYRMIRETMWTPAYRPIRRRDPG